MTGEDASVFFDCDGIPVEVVLPRPVVEIIAFPIEVWTITHEGREEVRF